MSCQIVKDKVLGEIVTHIFHTFVAMGSLGKELHYLQPLQEKYYFGSLEGCHTLAQDMRDLNVQAYNECYSHHPEKYIGDKMGPRSYYPNIPFMQVYASLFCWCYQITSGNTTNKDPLYLALDAMRQYMAHDYLVNLSEFVNNTSWN